MTQFYIYHFGKIKDSSIKTLISDIKPRLSRVKLIELKDIKAQTPELIKLKEYETLKPHLEKHNNIFILSEHGKEYSTHKFYDFTKKYDEVVFVVSGAFGPHEELIKKYQTLSLSQMTFTHEIALYILIEQLYRVECFKKNIPYTK